MKNLVKTVCFVLNITQKELALKVGVSEGTINRWSAVPDDMSLQSQKTLCLLLEVHSLKKYKKILDDYVDLLYSEIIKRGA